MKFKVKAFVAGTSALAVVLLGASFFYHRQWDIQAVLLWMGLCLLGELFWIKAPSGDSIQSLGATTKLASILVLDPWTALLVIYSSTVVGNFAFRQALWYRAIYNGSQLMLAGAGAAAVFYLLGGRPLTELLELSPEFRTASLIATVADQKFLLAFFPAGVAYILINNSCMALLMSAMSGRRVWILWQENCLYSEEIQSSLTLVLLTPLLVLLYGAFGVVGLILLFVCLALVHQANRRFLAVTKAQDDLIRSERMGAMGEMAQEIGKSLVNFLTSLKAGAGRLYQLASRTDSDHIVRGAEIIEVNVGHMSALVEGLAAFSHKETQTVPTDLNELLRRTIEFVKPQNRFDQIHFKFTPDPILPKVNVDPGQMQQVFINLLSNAADAMAELEKPVKKIFAETHYDPNGQRIRISVADNGPGIPEKNLARVFEPHFTTKVSGHGFGLSTVFRIASNHRGTVSAHNLPGLGAQFILDLPNA